MEKTIYVREVIAALEEARSTAQQMDGSKLVQEERTDYTSSLDTVIKMFQDDMVWDGDDAIITFC